MDYPTFLSWYIVAVFVVLVITNFYDEIVTILVWYIFAALFWFKMALLIHNSVTMLKWNLVANIFSFEFPSFFGHRLAVGYIIKFASRWIVNPNFPSMLGFFPVFTTPSFLFYITFF